MKFNQIPHPVVEDHYHIQDLINGQEKRSQDRTYHQEIAKKRDQDLKDIAGFKDIEQLDFWCRKCKKDFVGRAKKQIDGWENIAYYKIKHTCGTWAMRRITDRMFDEYFYKSVKVARDRYFGELDMIQPWQTGFNTLYGKK